MIEFIHLIEYFDSLKLAINFCENVFFNPTLNTNPQIINACADVWANTFNYN